MRFDTERRRGEPPPARGRDLRRQGSVGELPELGQSALYCVTEVHTADDIERLATALGEVAA